MRRILPVLTLCLFITTLPSMAGIDNIRLIPVEANNGPVFQPANVPGSPLAQDLAAVGYIEEEFFVSGRANSYDYQQGQLSVHSEALPYTTRVVIRHPANPDEFSGVVHIEPEHPSLGGTLHWLTLQHYITGQRDAYVSVGAGNDPRQRQLTADSDAPTMQSAIAKWFNPKRYEALYWPEDDGIRYEVFAHIAQWLRSQEATNPLAKSLPHTLIAGGWSFTGSFMRTFINYGFHDRYSTSQPVFDGYVVGISSRWNGLGVLPLNSDVDKDPMNDPVRDLKPVNVPVIEFITEFEVASGDGPQVADSDHTPGAHRLYEIGAVIHSDQQLLDQGGHRFNRPHIFQLISAGYPELQIGDKHAMDACPFPVSDIPHGPYVRASLHALKQWITDGIPPPHSAQLRLDEDGTVLRDHHENPMGGLPLAEFALPIAKYHQVDDSRCQRKGRPYMVRENFSQQQLKALYGSPANYMQQYRAYTRTLVAERWLLPEDATRLTERTQELVNAAF